MKHVDELIGLDWFRSKDWLILGTGPSLNTFDFTKHSDKNIIAIYAAEVVCKPTILLSPDRGTIHHYQPPFNNYQYLVTRAFNHHENENAYYFEYDCDFKSEHSEGTFHGGDGERYFPNITPYECSCTVKFAAQYLGRAGIKKVYTCGIDGGKDVFTKSPNWYLEPYTKYSNFDAEVKDFYDTCERFNIETIKL